MATNGVQDSNSGTAAANAEAFSPLELHVFTLLWQGARQETIMRAVNRSRRQVTRIAHQIAVKLGPFDGRLLRYRLEEELFRRIPQMADRDLIAALRLYVPRTPASTSAAPMPVSKKPLQQLVREVMPRGNADSAGAG
jgi:hypothetical protein